MVRKDGAAVRKERIQEIARNILRQLANHKELSLSQTVANLEYEYGLREEKIMEYLEIMANLGQFVLDKENEKIKKATDQ